MTDGRTSAVLLDLDDTLLVDMTCIERVLLDTCTIAAGIVPKLDPAVLATSVRTHARAFKQTSPLLEFCEAVGIASWELLAADFTADAPRHDELREWAPSFRRSVWGGALRSFDIDDDELALGLAEAYAHHRRTAYELFPDAIAALDQLAAAAVPLAVVTNGPADLQREKLTATGLDQRVDAIVISGELGIGKPDPAPVRAAIRALGLTATEGAAAVMVGDSLRRDVGAATAAGIRSVWIDRWAGGIPDESPDVPDAVISSLDGLDAALTSLTGEP